MRQRSRFDELLTVIFMLTAIGAIVCFFAYKDSPIYLILGGIAIVLRLAQYLMRMFIK